MHNDHMKHTALLLSMLAGWSAAAATDQAIDVSHWQGTVDWAKVKAAGVKLAIAKVTEGSSYSDDTFSRNWRGIKANGLQGGAYHYFRGGDSASSQVQNMKRCLQAAHFGTNDMLVIDVEQGGNSGVSKTTMADTLKGVLDGLQTAGYRNLWIYTGPWYWENMVAWNSHDFSKYKLWIAHYTSQPKPTVPSTWKSKGYSLWQYTDKGRVSGVAGNVDMSRFP